MWTAGGEGMVSVCVWRWGYYETPVLTLPGQLDSVTMWEGGGGGGYHQRRNTCVNISRSA